MENKLNNDERYKSVEKMKIIAPSSSIRLPRGMGTLHRIMVRFRVLKPF
jgi:hypothetical protein